MSDGTFSLSVMGNIEYIDTLAESGSAWYLKYDIVVGTDWKIANGIEAAVSQTVNVTKNGHKVILGLPVEVGYKSTNPSGCKYSHITTTYLLDMIYLNRFFARETFHLKVKMICFISKILYFMMCNV